VAGGCEGDGGARQGEGGELAAGRGVEAQELRRGGGGDKAAACGVGVVLSGGGGVGEGRVRRD